ncbi:Six-hairpin glycosidase-like protein, partial [Hyaloraphidium curvatum]
RAVHLTYLYFWAQRSGQLPYQRLAWRYHSCMDCRGPGGEDMSGGWYEATNALKFGGPFAHTLTILGWNTWNYAEHLRAINNLDEARRWITHGAEYILRAYPRRNVFVGQMGIGTNQDFLWQGPPEEWVAALGRNRRGGIYSAYLTTARRSSEIVGMSAAAMANAYMALRTSNATFAARCLQVSRELYDFATQFPGTYMNWGARVPAYASHVEFYPSSSFLDEVGQAAAFLYLATGEARYLTDAQNYWTRENNRLIAADGTRFPRFYMAYEWENHFLPLTLLLAQITNTSSNVYMAELRRNLDLWLPSCPAAYGNCRPNRLNPPPTGAMNRSCPCVYYTPAGLARGPNWGALRHTANIVGIALQYAKLLRRFDPADAYATTLVNWGIRQINYMLGDNPGVPGRPRPYSHLVGFGRTWARHPNHISSFNSFIDFPLRGQRLDIIRYDFVVQGVLRRTPQRFILYGALLGGPTPEDRVVDDHWNYTYTEPTQDYTAAMQSAALGLVELYNMRTPQSDCGLDLGWGHRNSSRALRRRFPASDTFHNCPPRTTKRSLDRDELDDWDGDKHVWQDMVLDDES